MNQIVWPIAVIKFNGTDVHCWDWINGGSGYLFYMSILDLAMWAILENMKNRTLATMKAADTTVALQANPEHFTCLGEGAHP